MGVAFSEAWKPRLHVPALRKIVLNARERRDRIYAKHGYAVIGEAETLFAVIRHVRMARSLDKYTKIGSLHK